MALRQTTSPQEEYWHESKDDSEVVSGRACKEEGNTEIEQRRWLARTRKDEGNNEVRQRCQKPVHADAVIINAFMHLSATKMEIQAKCKLSDGTRKTIGLVGLMPHKSANLADICRALLAKCKDGSGITNGKCIKARDEMLAAEMLAD